jgi:hypothetical protein
MGSKFGKEQQLLLERIQKSRSGLHDHSSELDIAQATNTLQDMSAELTRLKQDDELQFRAELTLLDQRIQQCRTLLANREKAEREIRAKRAWEERARKAIRALDGAREDRKSHLTRALGELGAIKKRKPGGIGTAMDPIVTEEDIATSLAAKQLEVAGLEEFLSASAQWNEGAIVGWYDEQQENKRLASDQVERARQQRHQQLSNPQLAAAIEALSRELKFPVDGCVDKLVDADLTKILVPAAIADRGEHDALELFAPPTATVSTAGEVIRALDASQFPSGTIRIAAERLVRSWSEQGAGPGARLRAVSTVIVVSGNRATFNIMDDTVFEFFRDIARAMVTAMDSDTSSRIGPTYRGEYNSDDKKKPGLS